MAPTGGALPIGIGILGGAHHRVVAADARAGRGAARFPHAHYTPPSLHSPPSATLRLSVSRYNLLLHTQSALLRRASRAPLRPSAEEKAAVNNADTGVYCPGAIPEYCPVTRASPCRQAPPLHLRKTRRWSAPR
eukprot:COSAG06_NODE_14219_length_1178_cov_1.163114_2_plen_133_part_01